MRGAATAGGGFGAPRVVAVVHLFTLGWITTSIMGALYQLLPVSLGAQVRSEALGHLSIWLYAPGVAVLSTVGHPLPVSWVPVGGTLLSAGAAGLIAALLSGSAAGSRVASVALAGGVGVVAVQMLRVSRRRPDVDDAIEARVR